MKKIYSLIGTLTIAFAMNAQNADRPANQSRQLTGAPQITGSQLVNAVSTTTNVLLIPASYNDAACQSEVGFYTAGAYGYCAGTNAGGDNYMAQKYSLTTYSLNTPATVMGVQALMSAGGTGTIVAEIYSDNAGVPDALLGTSMACDISTINTNSNTAVFIFSTPVALTGTDFYVAINFVDLDAAGTGTVAIAQTNTCTTNTSGAWEQFSDATWNSYLDPANWDWTTDLAIFPYVSADFTTGVKAITASSISIFPNPTSGILTINATEANSSMEVFNIIGEKVYSNSLVKGSNNIDLSGLSNGSYFVKMNSNDQIITKKVVISK